MAIVACFLLQADWIGEFRKLDLAEKKGKFDDACKTRVELEFKIIQAGKPEPLRTALKDANRDVRALAARSLGILGDKASAAAIAELAKSDPDALVRCMALQALGWLKAGNELLPALKADKNRDVAFMAGNLEAYLKDPADHAGKVRDAYKAPLKREDLAAAKVGQPAPDFAAVDSDGKPFRLSDYLKKKPIVLMFQIADW